ncbi:hypothetical protein [Demequina sp. NBRC 110053]|uniref:hypothetical protein n=1 Tax=Demequina sp. NBRC 110053 TaxID=1570342 RepID=UPI00135630FE|nr:hypothetical protein [Demequina sp. NBRC 110053]
MTDDNALAAVRQAEWSRKVSQSTVPTRLDALLRDLLTDGVTGVTVSAVLAARHVQAAVDIHHPSGEHQGPRGPFTRIVASREIAELLEALQRTCYHRHFGTWFQVEASVEPGRGIEIHVDDMKEPPTFDPPLSELEWQAEWFLHRRDDEHLPPWWRTKLYPDEHAALA